MNNLFLNSEHYYVKVSITVVWFIYFMAKKHRGSLSWHWEWDCFAVEVSNQVIWCNSITAGLSCHTADVEHLVTAQHLNTPNPPLPEGTNATVLVMCKHTFYSLAEAKPRQSELSNELSIFQSCSLFSAEFCPCFTNFTSSIQNYRKLP